MHKKISLRIILFIILTQNAHIMAATLTKEEIHFFAVTASVCSNLKVNSARREELSKEYPKFSTYTDSEIDKFCRDQIELAASIETEANSHEILFEPVSLANLSDWISQYPAKSKAIKEVEKDFQISSNTCGSTIYGRQINKALYSLLVIGEKGKDVENAIYYYQSCLLIVNQRHSDGLDILIATGEKSFKISTSQIDEIKIRAYFDHLIKQDKNGQMLHRLKRDRAIELLLRHYIVDSKKYESEITDFASEFIGSDAAKPYLMLISKFDRTLFNKIINKLKK